MAGIEKIVVVSGIAIVQFTNGAVAFSDDGMMYSVVAAPNLRVLDYENWVYAVTLGI